MKFGTQLLVLMLSLILCWYAEARRYSKRDTHSKYSSTGKAHYFGEQCKSKTCSKCSKASGGKKHDRAARMDVDEKFRFEIGDER